MIKLISTLFYYGGFLVVLFTAGTTDGTGLNVLMSIFKMIAASAFIFIGFMGLRINDCVWFR